VKDQPYSWSEILLVLNNGQDLSDLQARSAMREILEDRANTEQIKSFLLALKAKGESALEVGALVAEMLQHAAPILVQERSVDVVGTGGDIAHTINISTTSAIVAAAAGARVVKHGNRATTSLSGAADLLEALGVAINLGGSAVEKCVAELGIGFCFAPMFHPAMRFAGPSRKELGIPTVFNILGPLANPAKPQAAAIGVANDRALPIMAQVLADRGMDGFLFRGDDGLDEITLATTTTVLTISEGQVAESKIDPQDFGISYSPLADLRGGDAFENARITHSIFAGEKGAPRDAIILNSASAIAAFVGDNSLSPIERISAGISAATHAIDSGAAIQLLDRWIELSQKLALS